MQVLAVATQPPVRTRALEEKFAESCFIPYDWEPISSFNCLRYFAVSQFYDKRCNNEELERQHKPIECLVQLRGLEFALLPPPPPSQQQHFHESAVPLFVIAKQNRLNEHSVTRKALFYFNNQMILQSPNMREVCTKRIRNASEHFTHVATSLIGKRTTIQQEQQKTTTGRDTKKRERMRKLRGDFKLVEKSLLGTLERLK